MCSLRRGAVLLLFLCYIALFCLIISFACVVAAINSQTFYVPIPENDMLVADNDLSGGSTDTNTFVAISVVLDNTVIYWDHFEDTYELDILNVVAHASTRVYGNNILPDGEVPCAATNTCIFTITNTADKLFGGEPLVFFNRIPDNRNLVSDIYWDGGDKIVALKTVTMTRAAYHTNPGTPKSGATEVGDVRTWGFDYVLTIGENLGADYNYFRYTAAFIMAAYASTQVYIDIDATLATKCALCPVDATYGWDVMPIINEGQSHFLRGTFNAGATSLKVGAHIRATKEVQVHLLTGTTANYESRW